MITDIELREFISFLDCFGLSEIEPEAFALRLIGDLDLSDPNVRRVHIPARYTTSGHDLFYTF